ncbi:hypothetical protein JTB14_035361 [Gonioctena quinquepunctata]|nr:hypothetical protein JTB14_035361 [Gonioctena quinquepunctata]
MIKLDENENKDPQKTVLKIEEKRDRKRTQRHTTAGGQRHRNYEAKNKDQVDKVRAKLKLDKNLTIKEKDNGEPRALITGVEAGLKEEDFLQMLLTENDISGQDVEVAGNQNNEAQLPSQPGPQRTYAAAATHKTDSTTEMTSWKTPHRTFELMIKLDENENKDPQKTVLKIEEKRDRKRTQRHTTAGGQRHRNYEAKNKDQVDKVRAKLKLDKNLTIKEKDNGEPRALITGVEAGLKEEDFLQMLLTENDISGQDVEVAGTDYPKSSENVSTNRRRGAEVDITYIRDRNDIIGVAKADEVAESQYNEDNEEHIPNTKKELNVKKERYY